MPSDPRRLPTTYAVVLRHADGTTSRMVLSQAPGRLYEIGDVIEVRDSEWRVSEIAMDEDGRTVLTCDSVERQDGR
jgi:hypothetical protein